MTMADRREGGRSDVGEAGLREGLILGVAQALALVPGVSRNGATLAAGRALGFDRVASQRLSWAVGLPVLLGVSARELARVRRRGRCPRGGRAAADAALRRGRERSAAPVEGLTLLGGAGAAFFSTGLCARLARRRLRAPALAPFAAYRLLLATVVIVRLRRAK